MVITRFAPSPTGYLHIGSARTALFNWLFARRHEGTFLLRIEDTDRARSTSEATKAIFDGLRWLGLTWDGQPVSQFTRRSRHAEVARQMLAAGTAYKCFSTQEQIKAFRAAAHTKGRSTLFHSPWRDADPATHPDAPFVVRLKAPRDGRTLVEDKIQGTVSWMNETLDDMILLRSDGTPTYMLAVVVDDHDMGITHVIRGDDHLNNTARQTLLYRALAWELPTFAHIPLIHGADGRKLSKRHGALGVGDYRAMGYTAAGMRNYLTRLGWSHGDDEVFISEQAIEWFDLEGIGKSPARLDLKKLSHVSGRHIAMTKDAALLIEIDAFLAATGKKPLTQNQRDGLSRAIRYLKSRAKTLLELLDKAHFILIERPILPDQTSAKSLDSVSRGILDELTPHLQNAIWTRETLEDLSASTAERHGLGIGKLAAALRAALAGRSVTPSVFDMMLVLGREETLARLQDAASG